MRYLAKRLLLAIPTLLGVAVIVFFMLRVVPGDVVEVKMRADGASVTQEAIEAERRRLGLDRPLIAQFADYMAGLMVLDLGTSMWTGRPVTEEIAARIGVSFQVAVMAALLGTVIALPLGVLAALARNTWLDWVIRVVTVGGLAIPSFWLGMLMILALLWLFSWSPPVTYVPFHVDPVANLSQLVWPALAIGYRYAAVLARMVRSSVIEVMREDYIRTARSKGVSERRVVARHALRNAMLPAVTIAGLEFAFLLGGLVVTEQVFNLNGLGRLLVQAISHNDFTLIQGMVLMIATAFVVTNLLVDLLYAALDPRVRYT